MTSRPSPFATSSAGCLSSPRVAIRPFRPEDAVAFRELNEAWIKLHFGMEESDRIALNDPRGHILEPGGHIFIAVAGDIVIGCCALIPHGPGVFEVAKMAVAGDSRGRGVGRQILEHTIAQAKALGANALYLESNSNLRDAVHLYESVGFRHRSPEEVAPSPYVRANVFMDLKF